MRRAVGAVKAEAPAEGRGDRGEPLAMAAGTARSKRSRMLSTRLMTTWSRSSTPSNRTRPSNGRSSSAGSTICSRWPLSPAAAKRATAALTASSGDRKSPISTSWAARGRGSKAGQALRLGRRAADQLGDPRQRDRGRSSAAMPLPSTVRRSPPRTRRLASATRSSSARSRFVGHSAPAT